MGYNGNDFTNTTIFTKHSSATSILSLCLCASVADLA